MPGFRQAIVRPPAGGQASVCLEIHREASDNMAKNRPPTRNSSTKPSEADLADKTANKSTPQRNAPTSARSPSIPMLLVVGALVLVVAAGVFLLTRQPAASPGPTAVGALSPVANLQASDYHSLVVDLKDADRVWFGSHSGIQE